MMFQRDRQRVVVETNLDEVVNRLEPGLRPATYRRHARARFVEIEREGEAFLVPPEVGDPWCPLTVRARLHRMAEVFRRLPHDADTRPAQFKSCMPTPVREIFKDQPGEPMRVPVSRADYTAAKQVLDSLITFVRAEDRMVFWGVAAKLSHRRIGRQIHCNHETAGRKVLVLLDRLVEDWNARGWRPDATDVAEAREFIHRNSK